MINTQFNDMKLKPLVDPRVQRRHRWLLLFASWIWLVAGLVLTPGASTAAPDRYVQWKLTSGSSAKPPEVVFVWSSRDECEKSARRDVKAILEGTSTPQWMAIPGTDGYAAKVEWTSGRQYMYMTWFFRCLPVGVNP